MEHEIRAFFRNAAAFHAHTANDRPDDARESLDELLMLWFHAKSTLVQKRCESILLANGWQDEMDTLCEQMA